MGVTTIRVSKSTAKLLENLKREMGAKSIEEVILKLIRERKEMIIKHFFGVDAGKISKFREEDRIESRI